MYIHRRFKATQHWLRLSTSLAPDVSPTLGLALGVLLAQLRKRYPLLSLLSIYTGTTETKNTENCAKARLYNHWARRMRFECLRSRHLEHPRARNIHEQVYSTSSITTAPRYLERSEWQPLVSYTVHTHSRTNRLVSAWQLN